MLQPSIWARREGPGVPGPLPVVTKDNSRITSPSGSLVGAFQSDSLEILCFFSKRFTAAAFYFVFTLILSSQLIQFLEIPSREAITVSSSKDKGQEPLREGLHNLGVGVGANFWLNWFLLCQVGRKDSIWSSNFQLEQKAKWSWQGREESQKGMQNDFHAWGPKFLFQSLMPPLGEPKQKCGKWKTK